MRLPMMVLITMTLAAPLRAADPADDVRAALARLTVSRATAQAAATPADPYRLASYPEALAKVDAGQAVRLFVRVPVPAGDARRLHYHTDGFPAVAAGVYDCRLVGGVRTMTPVTAPAVMPARTGGGDHTHTCGACGTVFDHSPAGDPAKTHRCPSCGAGPWPVVTAFTPTAAAAPLAPAPAYKLTPAAVMYGSDCGPGG